MVGNLTAKLSALKEISDFFTGEECDFVVEMAKLKGMKDSPLAKDSEEIARSTPEITFRQWDANEDGLIDAEEVHVNRKVFGNLLEINPTMQIFFDGKSISFVTDCLSSWEK